jgi:hypothetical protein
MQDLSQIMAAHDSRRVARALTEEEEELMEIDSPQGSAQKRSNEKAIETSKQALVWIQLHGATYRGSRTT